MMHGKVLSFKVVSVLAVKSSLMAKLMGLYGFLLYEWRVWSVNSSQIYL